MSFKLSLAVRRPGHWYTNAFEVGTWANPPSPAPKANTTQSWELFRGSNDVASRVDKPGVSKGPVIFVGYFNTTEQCWSAVNASSKTFHSFTFHTPAFGGIFLGE